MNKQNSTILFMPSDDSLRSEEFHRYFRKNIQYFSAGNRLYVWINDKRCFEYMTKAQSMILMDSLIDPAYEGRVRSSALEETYKRAMWLISTQSLWPVQIRCRYSVKWIQPETSQSPTAWSCCGSITLSQRNRWTGNFRTSCWTNVIRYALSQWRRLTGL